MNRRVGDIDSAKLSNPTLLCSRTSFFGGPISTREASSTLGWRDTLWSKSIHKPEPATKRTKKIPLPVIRKNNVSGKEHNAPWNPETPAQRWIHGSKENSNCNLRARRKQFRRQKPVLKRHQQSTSLGVQTVELLVGAPNLPKSTPVGANEKRAQVDRQEYGEAVEQEQEQGTQGQQLAQQCRVPTKRQRLQGTFYGTSQPPAALQPIRTVDDEPASDLDSFIESDDENSSDEGFGQDSNDWRQELQTALGGYDPSKFASIDAQPLGRMRATYGDIIVEEERAARIGRAVDMTEAKAAARRKAEKQAKKQLRELLGDDAVSSDSSDSDDDESDDEEEEEEDERRRKMRGAAASALIA